jgi:preprotein translocase subunit SecF
MDFVYLKKLEDLLSNWRHLPVLLQFIFVVLLCGIIFYLYKIDSQIDINEHTSNRIRNKVEEQEKFVQELTDEIFELRKQVIHAQTERLETLIKCTEINLEENVKFKDDLNKKIESQ